MAKILITGGGSMLARHLCPVLQATGKHELFPATRQDADLLDVHQTERLFASFRPDWVLHLAGHNGNVEYNRREPLQVFSDSTRISLNVVDAAVRHEVRLLVGVLASCGYPPTTSGLNEPPDYLFGQPYPPTACHGYAKRNLLLACDWAREKGLVARTVCFPTLAGEYDSFDPSRTKVVGAMVRRFVDAVRVGSREVVCWGGGGELREILYAGDAALVLSRLAEHWGSGRQVSEHPAVADPWVPGSVVNVGSGQEVTVRVLAELTASLTGYGGVIRWSGGAGGQTRKRLAEGNWWEGTYGLQPTPLPEVLRKVIDYYRRLPHAISPA